MRRFTGVVLPSVCLLPVFRVLVCMLLAGWGGAMLLAQGTRVTVVLATGERVEAVLKSATASEVVVEVAGTERKFPLASVSQVIVGKPPVQPPQMQTAFKAFRTVRDALAAGNVEEASYTTQIDTLNKGAGFAKGSGEWADIRMAMNAALKEYESAAKDWDNRLDYWTRAEYDLNWAHELAGRADGEQVHREDRSARTLKIGQRVTGRLGTGDRQMPTDFDRKTDGAFNDIWTIDMRGSGTLLIEMSSTDVTPHLMLIDADGRRLDKQHAQFGDVEIRRRVSAGTYRIWAGASAPREVGSYTLVVTVHQ